MTRHNWEKTIAEQIPGLLRYAHALIRSKDLTEDLVQDCLERAWSRRYMWNPERQLRPWLFTIMHNIYINQLQKHKNAPETVSVDLVNIEDKSDPAEALKIRDFENALGELSPEYREVILLAGLENLSYKEIAAVTGLPMGTVMSRLSRARERLRQIMDGSDAENVVQLR